MQIVVETLSPDEANERGILAWPVSRRGVSRYAWHYDTTETCYLVSGLARIETEDGNVEVEAGDLVTLPAGLDCVWDIREPIAKHYRLQVGEPSF
jgi:uncharacterized protein